MWSYMEWKKCSKFPVAKEGVCARAPRRSAGLRLRSGSVSSESDLPPDSDPADLARMLRSSRMEWRPCGQRCDSYRTAANREVGVAGLVDPDADLVTCSYFTPITIESGPLRCSTRVCLKPASRIQVEQSAPV